MHQTKSTARRSEVSNWNFRSIGSFNSEGAVDHWAKENGVNAADVKTNKGADGK
jgi:hypothetical protein